LKKNEGSRGSIVKAIFKRAVPYADDAMNLPVADVEAAVPFYEQTFNSPPRATRTPRAARLDGRILLRGHSPLE
jgi:hypothetical protein